MQARFSFLDGCNGFLHRLQVTAVPFVGSADSLKFLALDTAALQHLMHLLVVESHNHAATHEDADFRIEQLVCNACGLRVLADALVCCLLERLRIVEEVTAVVFVNGCLANLQTVTMPFVVDGEHIDEF